MDRKEIEDNVDLFIDALHCIYQSGEVPRKVVDMYKGYYKIDYDNLPSDLKARIDDSITIIEEE